MGRLEKFLAKEETIQINGEDFKIPPLTVKDLPLILGAYKGDQVDAEGMVKLLMKYLKINFPEETDENLTAFPFAHLAGIMDAVAKVNGMQGDERIERIKQKIAERAQK